ncbi:MAG TPA: GNAT family N-acetyltransferase [Aeromicrobium sp.]|nr:GNAT family N-acetyltransferase [Aeromicrobium sp.]HKY57462.1 GNAT family N-acetyltransferase [Aeromicrobium sp.]
MTGVGSADVEAVIAHLKASAGVIAFPGGHLRTLTSATDALSARLATWRRNNAEAFATRFPVTDDGTRAWLQDQVIDNPRRVLFLVLDDDGRPIGNLGFVVGDSLGLPVEIDNVLRGEAAAPGLMRQALLALLGWLTDQVDHEPVGLRVLGSNERAVRFYEKAGFHEVSRVNLVAQRDGDRVSLVPGDTDVVDQYVTMTREPKARRIEDVEQA